MRWNDCKVMKRRVWVGRVGRVGRVGWVGWVDDSCWLRRMEGGRLEGVRLEVGRILSLR